MIAGVLLLLAAFAPAAQAGWGTSTLLETGSGAASSPRIVIDSSGNSIAVWTQDDGGTWKIYANRYSAASGAWGTATAISGAFAIGTPSLGIDGSGNAVVVWYTDGSVYANRFNASTGLWGTPATINTNLANGNAQVAVAANGKAVAVWTAAATDSNQRRIITNVFNGTSWGTASERAAGESKDYPPSIAVDASGNALLVFVRNDPEWGSLLKYSYFTASNSTWSAVTDPVSPSDKVGGIAPQVVFAGSNAILVWREGASVPAYIKANAFNGATKTWGGTPSTLYSATGSDQIYSFRMAARDAGDVLVAIASYLHSTYSTRISCNFYSAGSWTNIGQASVTGDTPNTDDFMPAIDAAGKAVVLYRLSGSGDTTIKSRRHMSSLTWYDALTVATGSNVRFATQTDFNPRAAWVNADNVYGAEYDEVLPAVPVITAPASGATVSSPVTVSGTGEKNSTVKVYETGDVLRGTTTVNTSGNWSVGITLAAGSRTIYAKATDGVGNTSAYSPDRTFTVSTPATVPAAPTITGITPGNGQLSVAFTAGSDGGSAITNYKYSTNNGSTYTLRSPASTTSPIVITGLSNGTTYSVKILAVNAVGDGTASATFTGTPATVPGAPTGVSAVAGNAQATVTFTPPSNNGGSAITGYTVTSTPGNITATGAASPITVTGLTNGTAYTFKVKATNAMGTGAESAASNSVTPATVPGAPTIGTATAGNAQATVTFTPPADNGGSSVTGYTVTSTPGKITATGTASPITVTGLTNGAAYTFKVKATNAAGTGAESAASNSVTPSAGTFTVTPTAGTGGTISPNTPQTVTSGETTVFTVSANTGYLVGSVTGCNGSLDRGTYTTGSITADCTVSASFNIRTYTVTFNSNGGSSVGGIVANHGSTISAPTAPTRTGYTFAGWYKESGLLNAWDFGSDTVTADTTLFAKWNIITYTVTFDSTGGSAVDESIAEHGSSIAAPEAPNKTGYNFVAWYKDAGLTSAWNFGSDTVTANVTLFARWTVDAYVVTFESNGGSAIDSATAEHGATIAAPADPVRTGYAFGGWYREPGLLNAWNFGSDTVTANVTLYAKWTVNQYTVTPSAGAGGSLNPGTPQTVDYNATTAFLVTPDSGYRIDSVTGCGGNLTANTYTTGSLDADCTVTAGFVANSAPTVPTLSAPSDGSEVTTQTPVLSVNASTDADGDPVSYIFEIDTVASFDSGNKQASGVVGTASWTTSDLTDNTRHYWRALATDGSASSGWMSTASFFVNTENDAPTVPGISSPANNSQASSLTPALSVTNASDADNDTLTYEFEVYANSNYTGLVASAMGIPQGGSGTTSWTVDAELADFTTYYWRARARDEHNLAGDWASAAFFTNTVNIAPTAPTLSSPASGSETASTTPVLTVSNATDANNDSLSYIFEVDTVNTFDSGNKQTSNLVAEGAGTTSWTPSILTDNTAWHWRVKANDGLTDGSWMAVASFFVNTANDAPGVPTLLNPAGGSEVTVLGPTLSVNAAIDIDNDGLTYDFRVYGDSGLTDLVASATGAGTSWVVNPNLPDSALYWWTARAVDEHGLAGGWMAGSSFSVNYNGADVAPVITLIKPAADEPVVTGNSFTITWTDSDPDSNATIILGYDQTGSGCGGTVITTGIGEDDSANSHTWDLTALNAGSYFVYAVIDDGVSSACSYAPGQITKAGPASGPTGDLNNDGTVNSQDALKALRIAAGIDAATTVELEKGDVAPLVNSVPAPDGKIDIGDVVVLLRKAVGLAGW